MDSLLCDVDVGPDLVDGVEGRLQSVLDQRSLDVQHTGRVIRAAVIDHVLHSVVQILHHQLLGRLKHAVSGQRRPDLSGPQL